MEKFKLEEISDNLRYVLTILDVHENKSSATIAMIKHKKWIDEAIDSDAIKKCAYCGDEVNRKIYCNHDCQEQDV